MAFVEVAANTLSGDLITNSLKFNNNDTAYLDFTPSGAGNKKTWTWSGWVKLGHFDSSNNRTLFASTEDSSNSFEIKFDNNDKIQVRGYVGGSKTLELNTNQLFRDVSAWYHVVYALDTSNGTAGNRQHLYINGSEVTSFSTETTPDQNDEFEINEAQEHQIGAQDGGNLFDGYMAYVHFIDGTQKAASDFGETNDNGVWIPKLYSGSYGTNGWKLEFKETGTSANASGKGADTSGQGNHWDDNGMTAEDITTDTPNNNFATLNPLNQLGSCLVAEGNLEYDSNSSSGSSMVSTIAPANGKWYCEVKLLTSTLTLGIAEVGKIPFGNVGGGASRPQLDYTYAGDVNVDQSEVDGDEATYTTNDIIGIALNLDDGEVIFYKNGTALNSGTAYNLHTNTEHENAGFYVQTHTGSGNTKASFNFGNPSFSISSGNADANGYGNFEYAVPSGYYALCTKNLAEYG